MCRQCWTSEQSYGQFRVSLSSYRAIFHEFSYVKNTEIITYELYCRWKRRIWEDIIKISNSTSHTDELFELFQSVSVIAVTERRVERLETPKLDK